MNTYSTSLRITLAILVCSLLAPNVFAQKKAKNDPDKKEWQQLFNGKDLKDWHVKIFPTLIIFPSESNPRFLEFRHFSYFFNR